MEQSQSYLSAFMPVLEPIVAIEAVLIIPTSSSAAIVHSEMDPLNKGHLCRRFTDTLVYRITQNKGYL